MTEPIIVYGQKGSGSVVVEAALLLIGLPHRVVERAPTERPEAGDLTEAQMAEVNPLLQVPALRLPNGELRLSPGVDDVRRPAFLRWMTFVSAQIYGLIWVTDDPRRLAVDEAHQAVIVSRVQERRAECWRIMDTQVAPAPYILGADLSVLDLYVTVVSAWGPGRKRFYEVAPKMGEVVRRVDRDPRLTALWKERFS